MRIAIIALACIGTVPLTAGEVRWTHLSSDTYDLPAPYAAPEPTAALTVDLDSDGSADIVVAARKAAPCLVWYRRTGSRWTRYIVDDSSQRIEAGGAYHDIDGDGDTDIISIGWRNPRVLLYENRAIR